MYKIKNLTKETRQFVDKRTGRIIMVDARKEITHNSAPKPSKVWKVEKQEEKTQTKIKTKKGETK